MKIFLKMKAWQLSLSFLGPFFISLAVTEILKEYLYFSLGFVVAWCISMAWFWSVGTNLNLKIPDDIRPNSRYFRISVVYCALYVFLHVGVWNTTVSGITDWGMIDIVLPFGIVGALCILYVLSFVSKMLVLVDQSTEVEWHHSASPLFFIWLFPVGIWIIQPKINEIFRDEINTQQKAAWDKPMS